jgi:phage/plasmid-like protein (TIGR03299 family)
MNTQTNNFADSVLNQIFSNVQNPENAYNVGEMLDKFNLNWRVEKTPLMLPNGTQTPYFGIVRQDNDNVFTTCKDSYIPFQNAELAEMLIRISEKTGYSIHSGGSFNGGAKVFLQLESPNKIQGIGENRDSVNGFLTGLNSHDGSTSLKWGETNITISCRNTFMAAMKALKSSARHTQSIHNRVEDAIRQLNGVILEEKSLFDQFIKLSEQPITKTDIAKVVKSVTDVDILKTSQDKEVSQYAINRANELLRSISQEIKQKGETKWGLLSGVTHYTSHKMPVPNRENGRLESLYTGSGFEINNSAFELVKA